ncbi:MAG: hydantoinase B/oxoprolinase family protein, partial [Paracoccaceae bacterium]
LCAKLEVSNKGISIDFDGSSRCSGKGINVPLNYATAYSVFALRCIVGPDIPNNAGSLEPFKVVAPEGCILNAQPPAPVAMRHTIGQMTPDLVYGCLSQALPDLVPAEGASCMYDLPLRNTAEAILSGGTQFALELVYNGGTGARPKADGLSATAFPSGVWGSQVEMTEAVAPVLITKRELRQDSGGAGTYRGGLGQRIEMVSATNEDLLLFLSVDRIDNAARGRQGGKSGATGRIRIGRDGPDLPGKGTVRIPACETLIFETPGGGGFGDPADRSRDAVRRDLSHDLISDCHAAGYNGKSRA